MHKNSVNQLVHAFVCNYSLLWLQP